MSEQIESTTIAPAGTTTTAVPSAPQAPAQAAAGDLAKVRDLIIARTPNAVPELITGNTVDELVASVDSAIAVYDRIAAGMRGDAAATPAAGASGTTTAAEAPPAVPGGAHVAVPLAEIPTMELIRRGLAELKTRRA